MPTFEIFLHPGPAIEAKGPSVVLHDPSRLSKYLLTAGPEPVIWQPCHVPVFDLVGMFRLPQNDEQRQLMEELRKLEDSDMVLVVRRD